MESDGFRGRRDVMLLQQVERLLFADRFHGRFHLPKRETRRLYSHCMAQDSSALSTLQTELSDHAGRTKYSLRNRFVSSEAPVPREPWPSILSANFNPEEVQHK